MKMRLKTAVWNKLGSKISYEFKNNNETLLDKIKKTYEILDQKMDMVEEHGILLDLIRTDINKVMFELYVNDSFEFVKHDNGMLEVVIDEDWKDVKKIGEIYQLFSNKPMSDIIIDEKYFIDNIKDSLKNEERDKISLKLNSKGIGPLNFKEIRIKFI